MGIAHLLVIACFVIAGAQCTEKEEKDLYEVLGAARDAGPKDIKKAFRRLAIWCNPDNQRCDTEKFKEITRAYEVLSDEEKRGLYDLYGLEAVNLHEKEEECHRKDNLFDQSFANYFEQLKNRKNS